MGRKVYKAQRLAAQNGFQVCLNQAFVKLPLRPVQLIWASTCYVRIWTGLSRRKAEHKALNGTRLVEVPCNAQRPVGPTKPEQDSGEIAHKDWR